MFAESLLCIPRTLAENSGFDAQDTVLKAQEEHMKSGKPYGIDVLSGEPLPAAEAHIFDNYIVKR